jgi:hypothetical protein
LVCLFVLCVCVSHVHLLWLHLISNIQFSKTLNFSGQFCSKRRLKSFATHFSYIISLITLIVIKRLLWSEIFFYSWKNHYFCINVIMQIFSLTFLSSHPSQVKLLKIKAFNFNFCEGSTFLAAKQKSGLSRQIFLLMQILPKIKFLLPTSSKCSIPL